MIVDHRGDSSHERHPGRHVQVEMAGLGHPEIRARETERERERERGRERERKCR